MKPKKEILKMSKDELINYKWSDDLELKKENSYCYYCSNCSHCSDCYNCSNCSDCSDCSNCSHCSDCSNCSHCSDCSNCFGCRNLGDKKKHQYKICNVQLTKEEYEKKMKEISGEQSK